MDTAQSVLFDQFPRLVGNPNQFPVFDEGSFDEFLGANEGESNCYSRISWLSNTGEWLLDKVFFDLDGHVPESALTDVELVTKLQNDRDFRQDLLGEVVDDVRSVASLAVEESLPLVGVYTGKGVHLHVLTEPRRSPGRELRTNQLWISDVCDLDTFDHQVLGDIKRLCRVPNCRRYDTKVSTDTELFTIPLNRRELKDITAYELMKWSLTPKDIEEPGESRPPLFVREDYLPDGPSKKEFNVEPVDVGEKAIDELDEKMEEWLKDVLQLPCMYERIMTRNPAHPIRFNAAVMMFNVGMTPEDVVEVFSRLGWHDFDPQVTRTFANQIYEQGYADMSCATLQSKQLCLYEQGERSSECEAFGYKGGLQEY